MTIELAGSLRAIEDALDGRSSAHASLPARLEKPHPKFARRARIR